MATSTLAKSRESFPDRPYDGNLIDNLVDTVERVERPKPPQSAPEPDNPADNQRDKNAAMLLDLWDRMGV